MNKPILLTCSLVISLLLSLVARSEVRVTGEGIDPLYCARILAQVEQVAGCKAEGDITVVVEDRITSGFAGYLPYGFPVLGMYEEDRRVVSITRDCFCSWLLAHEFAHAVYCDHYLFHPEAWADITADAAVGHKPGWLKVEH